MHDPTTCPTIGTRKDVCCMVSPSSAQYQQARIARADAIRQLVSIGRVVLWLVLTIPGCLLFALLVPLYGSTLALFWPFLMMAVVGIISHVSTPVFAFLLAQHYLNTTTQAPVVPVYQEQASSVPYVHPPCANDILEGVYTVEEDAPRVPLSRSL